MTAKPVHKKHNITQQSISLADVLREHRHDPFSVLGMHQEEIDGKQRLTVRALVRNAASVDVVDVASPTKTFALEQADSDGIFTGVIPRRTNVFRYQLRIQQHDGNIRETRDPYSFLPVLSDFDLHLFSEGNHFRICDKLGAHLTTIDNTKGVHFAVWAPNAKGVSVVGDFNNWDGRYHLMRVLGNSGVWEIFIPGLDQGALYKFEILTPEGHLVLKSDPYGFHHEVPPRSASVVINIDDRKWNDDDWMATRHERNWLDSAVAVYEVHLGSWRRVPEEDSRPLNYRELAEQLTEYVKDMGFTHVELLPIAEHPYTRSWGYQVSGFYAPSSRWGSPEDLQFFVEHMHRNGIGVLMDWVPAHFPRDAHALARFDGTALYEHEDPKQGEHLDWGTLIFNYGRNEVRNFLLSNAMFWLDRYHIDGLRVDAVASMLYLDYSRPEGEWIANQYGGNENLEAVEFLKQFNILTHGQYPGILTIAEESTAWPGVTKPTYLGGLGFSLKWNMGWMHDMLTYMSKEPIYRRHHQDLITFALLYAFHENFVLTLSHDEVVHGKRALLDKMPGNWWDKFANLRAFYGFMYGHPGKKTLFMGCEFGQWNEWDSENSLDWNLLEYPLHQGLKRLVRDLNYLYRSQPALYENDFHHSGFEWIDFHDVDRNVISFLRRAKAPENFVVFVTNFSPMIRFEYRIGVPESGYYQEMLNTDSSSYGGSGAGNSGGVCADPVPWQGRPWSVKLTLPPLSTLVLKRK